MARAKSDSAQFSHLVCGYERPLICYPGQEARFVGKRRNSELVLASVDGLVIGPGEMFSFWSCVGRPTRRAGFLPAAALKDRRLVEDVGGAVCLTSTLLYNVGLLSGMKIVERHSHSVDSYGDARYFELGRDAAVEYAYLDLRFRNDFPQALQIHARIEGEAVVAEVWAESESGVRVEICVERPVFTEPPTDTVEDRSLPRGTVVVDDPGATGVRVRTKRIVHMAGRTSVEDLGLSIHHPYPGRERVGTGPSVRS